MSRIQRRIFLRGAIVGALLTITVIALDLGGFLSAPENWLYDQRARHFQFATTKPTDLLVHIDIDDKSLDVTGVGAWPWPRAKLAAILDEMRIAGVKAVALDILYPEAQDVAPTATPSSSQPSSQPAQIDNDAALAAAIRMLGCVVVPESLLFDPPNHSPIHLALVQHLRVDPELDEIEMTRRLASTPLASPDLSARVASEFVEARKDAMFQRISQEVAAGSASRSALRSRILKTEKPLLETPVGRVFDQQYDRWDSISNLERLGASVPSGAPPIVNVAMDIAPIPMFTRAAAATGFVDYKTARDGVLRTVPLVANLNGRIMPQMGLSLALVTMGLSPHDLQFGPDSIVIPRPEGTTITIPVHDGFSESQGKTISSIMDIPWFGGTNWSTMYDWPAHIQPAQHLTANIIWTAYDTRRKLAHNNEGVAFYLPKLCKTLGIPMPLSVDANELNPFSDVVRRALEEGGENAKLIRELPASELDADLKNYLEGFDFVKLAHEENAKLVVQLQEQRKDLATRLAGKSVLVGWIASGQIDVTPTSVQPKVPGVVAHGVIFNAIMTGQFWRRAPDSVTVIATLGLGLLGMLLASWTAPFWGLVATVLLGVGYTLFNGYFLFDKQNVIVGMAGPLSVLGVVWAGCTINRMIIEAGERARITRRFSTYADPTLVKHVLENPDQVRLEGETRELSVVFTDLAGFTAISERLGEQTVSLLNEYLGLMVPIIRSQNGYVNKFLGDGIMFFFGAPIPNSNHALQAVQSVMEMRRACDVFNEELLRRGLTKLGMRAGISTGLMVVGDAGTSERSDYTVLGDLVNLASRLESANKATGSGVLINDRTAEFLSNHYLLRPIGRLQVVGKEISVMTHEPIAVASEATNEQKQFVQLTAAMVDAYIAADFPRCLAAADQLELTCGSSPLITIYRVQCRHYIEAPAAAFDGRIELKEK